MVDRQHIPKFVRGTTVKTTVKISESSPTSVTITIDDPTSTEKVSAVVMTNSADKVYTHQWQSTTTNREGDYVVTIKVTSGSYTTIKQDNFTLVKQQGSE